MRKTLPPRLALRSAQKDRHANWVVRHGTIEIRTGCRESERCEAEIKLAQYIVQTRRPEFSDGDPYQISVADVLIYYNEGHGDKIARPDGLASELDKLGAFFADKKVSDITETTCDSYVRWRTSQTDARATKNPGRRIAVSTARRELVTLSAAVGWAYRHQKIARPIIVYLPKVAERRDRYLTRSEIARLLLGALGFDLRTGKRNRFRINYYVARFILIAYETATRHETILQLQWFPNTTGGWVDLERAILYRRPEDAIETNKKRTPVPISQRLLVHLKRWRRLSVQYIIERDGEGMSGHLRRSWAGARELAGLDKSVTPHVLRHSLATHLLQRGVSTWDVAGILGTSEAVIRKTYGHHCVEHLRQALDRPVFGRSK
jgi:integrase